MHDCFACVYVSAKPTEVRSGHWSSWNWSYQQSLAVMRVLWNEPGSSARAISAFNCCWAISPSWYLIFSMDMDRDKLHPKQQYFPEREVVYICIKGGITCNVCKISPRKIAFCSNYATCHLISIRIRMFLLPQLSEHGRVLKLSPPFSLISLPLQTASPPYISFCFVLWLTDLNQGPVCDQSFGFWSPSLIHDWQA